MSIGKEGVIEFKWGYFVHFSHTKVMINIMVFRAGDDLGVTNEVFTILIDPRIK